MAKRNAFILLYYLYSFYNSILIRLIKNPFKVFNEPLVIPKHANTQVLVIVLVINGILISIPVVGARDVTDAGLVFGRPRNISS